jgi:hypothetical protein
MSAKRRIEIPTTGIDEALQLVGSDPFGGMSWVGLRVPFLPTEAVANANGETPQWENRYVFVAATYSVGEGEVGRIIGYRQMVTIGAKLPIPAQEGPPVDSRVVEQLVTSPFWHFPDGGVSWHIRRLGPPNAQGLPARTPAPGDLRSFAHRWSDTPALLYDTATVPAGDPFYVDLTAYKPPNGGQPYGEPLSDGHQGTFLDQRIPWVEAHAWSSLDIEVEGPDTIALIVTVAQTDPNSPLRPIPSIPTAPNLYPAGLSSEEQFLLNFPTAQYWRIAGSLIVEAGTGSRHQGRTL